MSWTRRGSRPSTKTLALKLVVVANHDPGGGDAHPPYLRGGVRADDHVGTERRCLSVEGIGVGEAHVVVGAGCSQDVPDRFAVHGGRYGDQYAHLGLRLLP